jgi:inner membrane protein
MHRGITHSILGAVVETAALSLLVAVILRGRGPSVGRVLAVVAACVASHPFMDWQGSYGLRPFLPWSNRWYYGDFVAIVDVWYWLLPLVALAWGARRHWHTVLWYGPVWLGPTLAIFVLFRGESAVWLRAGWILVSIVGAVGWVQHWFGPAGRRLAATGALTLLAVYAGAQAVVSFPVKAAQRRAATARFGPHARWAALTVIGHPFVWERMIGGPDSAAGPGWAVARHLDVPAVQRVLRDTPDGRDIASFARFLVADVDSTGTPWRVQLRDVRYGSRGGNSWAGITVAVPDVP